MGGEHSHLRRYKSEASLLCPRNVLKINSSYRPKIKFLNSLFRGRDILNDLAALEVNSLGQFQPLAEEIIWLHSVKELLNKKISYIQLCNAKAESKIRELQSMLVAEKKMNRAKIRFLIEEINRNTLENKLQGGAKMSGLDFDFKGDFESPSQKPCSARSVDGPVSKKTKSVQYPEVIIQSKEDNQKSGISNIGDNRDLPSGISNIGDNRDLPGIPQKCQVSKERLCQRHVSQMSSCYQQNAPNPIQKDIEELIAIAENMDVAKNGIHCQEPLEPRETCIHASRKQRSKLSEIKEESVDTKYFADLWSTVDELAKENQSISTKDNLIKKVKDDLSNHVAKLIMERESLLQAVLEGEDGTTTPEAMLATGNARKLNPMGDAN